MSEVNKFVTQQFSLFKNEESVQLPNLTESVTDSPYSSYVV